jgi:hypothetical protein
MDPLENDGSLDGGQHHTIMLHYSQHNHAPRALMHVVMHMHDNVNNNSESKRVLSK